ncbi:GNAT family N-acetyltransferase [Arenibacter sp. BSSL-BM3]|uniref:GNAT family N-acetyltransferase n=1 Tax=Arenibacter arenosicollis TaxID=2762274 RepID=A0ABR7QTA1_9FLAO|nr:GNAT family N-acetyltransferase [Arenibacter arenosicollis]MBC8770412.1 GNAT family N-acetyltransferase [Arenibacter arenosicollis]
MKYLLTGQETERLKFRLLKTEDFDSWVNLFKSDKVAEYLDLDPKLTEPELCQIWFDKAFHRYENDLGGMNVLIDKKTNRLVGQCGLLVQTIENRERLEIGYSILPEFWKNGFAIEAATKCKDYAFENNFADSLISMIHLDNLSSEKVALRNGMTLEKKIKSFNIFRVDKESWNQ